MNKRRKVWVNFYAGAGPLPDTWGTHIGTKATVLRAAQEGAEQVHLVELRRGDAVWSKEDQDRAVFLLDRVTSLTGWGDGSGANSAAEELRELLRGHR